MDDNRQQMIAQIKALKELQRRRAQRNLRDFLPYINPKYEMKWFHRGIADVDKEYFDKGCERFDRECHGITATPSGTKYQQTSIFDQC